MRLSFTLYFCPSFDSLRSWQGINFFPRIFFLLFALFHFYLFSFPFGFSYTALSSTVCFMIHSMLFFWHRFELPAVALGFVNAQNPRMGIPPSPTIAPPPPPASQGRDHDTVPHMILPPRLDLIRQQSHGTISSLNGGTSRQSSTSLFHRGDDGDESYMYFMDGEVVMHRGQSVSPFAHTNGASAAGSAEQEPGFHDNVANGGLERVGGIPDHVLAELGVGPVDDFYELETLDIPPEAIRSGIIEDPPETSTLQAILNANTTPRIENLSRQNSDIIDGDDALVQSAPCVPLLGDDGQPNSYL
jgi:hypothetical protein